MFVVLFDCVERVIVVLIVINELDLYSKEDGFLEDVIKPFKYHEADLLT